MKIAMLGLGKMGGNMATRLIRNGISVVGYDTSKETIAKLEQEENLIEFFETLEDNDDVQNIFSNVELNTN